MALAEMALAGGLGADVSLARRARATTTRRAISSCSSRNHPPGSCSRCLPSVSDELSGVFAGLPLGQLGLVTASAGDRGPASAAIDRSRTR